MQLNTSRNVYEEVNIYIYIYIHIFSHVMRCSHQTTRINATHRHYFGSSFDWIASRMRRHHRTS